MQARTTVPLTSISQAPQLPLPQAVGITWSARRAAASQCSPAVAPLRLPSGQWITTGAAAISAIGGEQGGEIDMPLKGIRQAVQELAAMGGVADRLGGQRR